MYDHAPVAAFERRRSLGGRCCCAVGLEDEKTVVADLGDDVGGLLGVLKLKVPDDVLAVLGEGHSDDAAGGVVIEDLEGDEVCDLPAGLVGGGDELVLAISLRVVDLGAVDAEDALLTSAELVRFDDVPLAVGVACGRVELEVGRLREP